MRANERILVKEELGLFSAHTKHSVQIHKLFRSKHIQVPPAFKTATLLSNLAVSGQNKYSRLHDSAVLP